MNSSIWLQACDGSILQVEEEVAMFSPTICREVLENRMGLTKNYAISLPQRVSKPVFDEKFIRIDTESLCELTAAADSLQLKPLVDLTNRALAGMIDGKKPDEIRETFNLPDDLTEEEKLEPLINIVDYPQIRLLNRLYARKRKELKEKEKQTNAEVELKQVEDERPVDDLLSFINGGGKDSKVVKSPKHKKRNRKRKHEPKDPCTNNGKAMKEADTHPSALLNGEMSISSSQTSKFLDLVDDIDDDELDPAMKEEIDKEVEEFARRLDLDWPKRMQEILSSGQEGRLAPILLNETVPLEEMPY
ncbi:hypothetical protein MKX03_011977 [Papaver bracteatum]|nr:hypothetical protein MKX03_011977 [Papaver bracteatum]